MPGGKRAGIQQQILAAQGCISATVVRRIEKGDYESAPHPSLITAVAHLGGPSDELRELAATYRALQARQRPIDNLLQRKEMPDNAGWRVSQDDPARLAPGLRAAISPRS